MLSPFGTVLNLIVVAAVFAALLILYFPVRKLHARRNPSVLTAYAVWSASWLIWVFTWIAVSLRSQTDLRLTEVALALSDLHNVLLFAFAIVIVVGRRVTASEVVLGIIIISLAIVSSVGYSTLAGEATRVNQFHRALSLASGVGIPMIVGLALARRYRLWRVAILCLAYSVSLPATHQALFDPPASGGLLSISPDVVLVLLAILKIGLATSITRAVFLDPDPKHALPGAAPYNITWPHRLRTFVIVATPLTFVIVGYIIFPDWFRDNLPLASFLGLAVTVIANFPRKSLKPPPSEPPDQSE